MTKNELTTVMDNFYGGSDGRYRHMFNRRFIYTEGVKAVFEAAGAYWLGDIVATEVAPICLQRWESQESHMHFLRVRVAADKPVGDVWLEEDSDQPVLWQRHLDFTTFPEGDWTFYLGMDSMVQLGTDLLVMFLPQEN